MSKIWASKPSAKVRRYRHTKNRYRAGHWRNRRLVWRDAFALEVERMTNPQRSAWARAGYPGNRERDVSRLSAFLP